MDPFDQWFNKFVKAASVSCIPPINSDERYTYVDYFDEGYTPKEAVEAEKRRYVNGRLEGRI